MRCSVCLNVFASDPEPSWWLEQYVCPECYRVGNQGRGYRDDPDDRRTRAKSHFARSK